MILDTNLLKDIIVTDSYVIGKAAEQTDILRQNERVMLFQGTQTALNYINENLDSPRQNESSEYSSGHAGNTFKSYSQAMDTFRNRPYEVVKYDPTEMRPIEFEEQGNDLEYDVTGDFIDIGAVLEGVPEHFGRLHNGNPRNRRVRIVVYLAQSWRMKPTEIDHRSERIIRLVDALENANVRTEVIAVDTNGCSHTEVLVKKFDEPLTIEDIAVVTHSEFFRRMCFRASEWSDTWRGNYGDSAVLSKNIKILKSQYNDEITIYVDSNMEMYMIDPTFDKLEKKIESELSEAVPQLSLISVTRDGMEIHPF